MLKSLLTACFTVVTSVIAVSAQTIPDSTLGNERSRIEQGNQVELIRGGAQRGQNLFHSFSEFNIAEQQRLYFANPVGVQNILTRVTGKTASMINGTLGVVGRANLFLVNPNGILFGPDAQLDVRGSFLGTSASSIRFGNQGEFSTIDLNSPVPLLIVQPSALLFNQTSPGPIRNQALLASGLGQNLTLVGGDIQLERAGDRISMLNVGGHIEVAAISGIGAVPLNSAGRLDLPPDIVRGDVSLKNAQILVVGNSLGSVSVYARDLTLTERSLISRFGEGVGSAQGQAGDILIDATGDVLMTQRSVINNVVENNDEENSGNIQINAQSLSISNGSELDTSVYGQGNSGQIRINVADQLLLTTDSTISSKVIGIGESDGIQISSRSLLINQAFISAGETGRGVFGPIQITATDSIRLTNGSEISSFTNSSNRGADIRLETPELTLSNSILNALIFNSGRGSNIYLTVKDKLSLDSAQIGSLVTTGSSGDGGEVLINAGLVKITNSGQIVSDTQGQGNASNLIINASSLDITNLGKIASQTAGTGNTGDILIKIRDRTLIEGGIKETTSRSAITTIVGPTAISQAGNIELNTGTLEMQDLAQIISSSQGKGNTGNININVQNSVLY